jgi:Patatin-like phospholipase
MELFVGIEEKSESPASEKSIPSNEAPDSKKATKLTPGERAREHLWNIVGVVFVVLLIMSYVEGRWGKVWDTFWYVLIFFSVLGMIAGMRKRYESNPLEILAAIIVFASVGWVFAAGTFHSWSQVLSDLVGITCGVLFATGIRFLLARRRKGWQPTQEESQRQQHMSTIGYLLAAWIGITAVTLLRPSLLPTDAQRFASIGPSTSITPGQSTEWKDVRVGLALSGGGYRAAVFHTGTLHALESLGIRVANLSTVSGGSIIGSYYAVGGDPVAFKDAVAAGQFNLKRELLLFHNVVRLPFPMRMPGVDVEMFPLYSFSRRDAQAEMVDRLLLHGQQHSAPLAPDAPNLVVNTTDLTYALLVGFLPDGIVVQDTNRDYEVYKAEAYRPLQTFSLSERVAISGAFPLAFPPAKFDVKVRSARATGTGTRELNLADGGVADNSGLHGLVGVHTQACVDADCGSHQTAKSWHSDVMLVSDGGAIFGVENSSSGADQLSRAVDVGGARAGGRYNRLSGVPTVYFSAQQLYLDPGNQFRLYNNDKQESIRANGDDKHVRFDPRDNYPDSVLAEIVKLLPEESYPNVRAAWESFKSIRGNNDSVSLREWSRTLPLIADSKTCESLENAEMRKSLPGICEAAELRRAVTAETKRLLESFRQTSTLDDQIDTERVDGLFRLGQLLVYTNWYNLNEAFTKSICAKNTACVQPVSQGAH